MDGSEQIQKAYQSLLESDFDQAIGWFEDAIRIEPNNPVYHYKLSITYARSNKIERAIEHALSALELDSANVQYREHMKNMKAKQLKISARHLIEGADTHTERAILYLKRAIQLDPLTVDGYVLLAQIFEELGQYKNALYYTSEVLKLDPEQQDAKQLSIIIAAKMRNDSANK